MPETFTIPGAPAALMDIINARRARIPAGLMMMADDTTEPPEASESPGGDFKSEHSKQAVLTDLAKEREERKALQKQVDELAPLRQQMEAIAAVFGKQEDAAKDGEDVAAKIADMQRRLDEADAAKAHSQLVADVASNYDSLSAADVALVAKLSERDAMEALAKRLSEGAKPGIPRPDRSVGKGGSGKADGGSVSAGRDLYRERHQRNNS